MIILLSNTSEKHIQKIAQKISVKRWVYFGKNNQLANKLNKMFGDTATPVDYAKKLYIQTQQKRTDFINWIDDISTSASLKKEWLFSMPAVKNTYSSNLFLYVCYFFVLEQLIRDDEKLDLVIVDSPALCFLFKKYFSTKIKFLWATYIFIGLFQIRTFLRTFYRFIRFFLDAFKRLWAARRILKFRVKAILKDKENFVLIRNFITSDFSCKDDYLFAEYYFPGLEKFLKGKHYSPVFLPMTSMVSNYDKLFSEVKESQRSIVVVEEFLKLSDYFYTALCPIKALFCTIAPQKFCSYELTELVREEYFSNVTEFGVMMATLLSRVGKRFKENKFYPVGIINWNENQAIEKGLISGFKKVFSDIMIIGSQPFITPPNHLSIIPSNQDKLSGLMPDKMLVLGPIGQNSIREFVNDINVDFSPAFRYTNLLQKNQIQKRNSNLLVLFGYDFDNSLHILKILLKANGKLRMFDNIFMKIHPLGYFTQQRLIDELGEPLPGHFSFVSGKVENYLDKASVGICGATSAGIELILHGIPVIVVGDERVLTMNYLSYREDQNMWQLCFNEDEVVKALNQFYEATLTQQDELFQKAGEFRKAFFAEQSEQHWENYLVNN